MTEVEAAIAREQLKKLKQLVDERINNVNYLIEKFQDIPCIKTVPVRTHKPFT